MLGKVQHFAIDLASCKGSAIIERIKAGEDLQKQEAQLQGVTIIVGHKMAWQVERQAGVHPMIDEILQRRLMEVYITVVQLCQTSYGWILPYQMEYKVDKEVLLRIKGGELREYQGAFKFDSTAREIFGCSGNGLR